MEPNYHLPPIIPFAKGVSRTIQPTNNSLRSKQPGRTQLPPLKRVVALPGIEKEKIASPRSDNDQQHVDKKKRKKKRNRCRSHEPAAAEPLVDVITSSLSQSTPYATRFNHPPSSSSPKLQQRHHSARTETEEFDLQNYVDFHHKQVDELRGENPPRIGEESYLRNGTKIQSKARNGRTRNSAQKNNQADNVDDDNSLAKENGPALVNVLSTDQSHLPPEGKEEYAKSILYKEEGYGRTEKCFQQKRRGTRIVQSKDHLHSVHPLEFQPHPPPKFRATPCKNQHAMIPHPNIPANDPWMNYSRNARSQVRQGCTYGESIQPHPPLQPRSFMNPIRQCNSLSEFPTLPLDSHASSSAHVYRNTTLSKTQSLGPTDVYPDRCPEPRSPCRNMIGHHSYRNVGGSPVLSGFAPHPSRDYFMHSQVYPPLSPITKTSNLKHFPAFYSNRISPTMKTNQALDVHNTAFPDTEPQPYFPTSVHLPANYKWAIIDDSGAVTPLPPGAFPAIPKRDAQEPGEKSLDSPEVSPCSLASSSSPNISALHLPDIKHLPELQTPRAPNNSPESSRVSSPPQRDQRCLDVGSKDERPQERIFEKFPSPTSVHWKKEHAKGATMANPSSCKPLMPDPEVAFFKDSPKARRSVLSLTEIPSENMESTSATEQNNPPPSPNGEKKQRNFKLPIGWYSTSKIWFKSPFKKEKKVHRKTNGMPPKNSQLPSLLTIDEFSSLSISDEKKSNGPDKDNKKRSVYTLGEFLMLCDEDGDGPDMLTFD